MSKPPLTQNEFNTDWRATKTDIQHLEMVVGGLRGFTAQSGGEDRRHLRMDVIRFESLLAEAEGLLVHMRAYANGNGLTVPADQEAVPA